jgi:hypothetical protein
VPDTTAIKQTAESKTHDFRLLPKNTTPPAPPTIAATTTTTYLTL